MAQGNFTFGIRYNVDKSGIKDFQQSLAQLKNIDIGNIKNASGLDQAKQKLDAIKTSAGAVEKALANSFNPTLNTYNIDKFQVELKKLGYDINGLAREWSAAGAQGDIAMRNMATALTNVNIPLKETHNLLKSMGQTLTNTIKWSIASNAINTVTGSVQKAWNFTKQLDTSLNDIIIVTGKSADEMDRFAQKANTAAKNLGATTNQYAQAALIYYQQGLAEEDVMSRSDVTVKAANVTGQSTQAVSEQLTAIWNGYKTSAAEAELYIDKVSAVAATTAADLEELSTGMSKVASAANAMGVDIDQLNAQLATIVSVTRQDSAVVGTALKTIYSRMGDLMVDGEDEFGTKLGEVSSSLKTMGIDVLDAQGNLRDMGIVIEEVATKWNTWTEAQQQAAAVAIAGKRQYNNLIALFENWDMYESAKATSQDSVGTLQKQQETYLDSLDARFDKLQATAEDLYLSLLDADSFKEILDIITKLVDKLGDFSDAIGGGGAVLSMLVPLMTQMFSGTVSKGISTFVTNMQQGKTTAEALKTSLANIDTILESDSYDQAAKDAAAFRKELNLLYQSGVLTNEEYQSMNDTLNSTIDTFNKASEGQIATEESKRIYKDMSIAFTPDEAIASEALVNQAGELYAKAGTSGQAILSTEDKTILEEYDQSLNAIKEAYGEAAISAEMFVEAVEKTNCAYQKNKDKDFEEAFGQLENNYTSAREALEQFKKAGLITAEEAERATKSLTRAMSNWNEDASPEAIEEFRRKMEKVNQVFEKAETNFASAGKVISSGLRDAATETEKAKAAAQGLQDILKTGLAKHTLEQDIQAFMNLTSTITSAISAFTILSNIGNIWDNEDLTVMQKMGQTITNLLTAAGMALPIVKLITIETKKISAEGAKQIVLEGLKAQAKDAANKEGGEQLFYENLIKETIEDKVEQQAMLLGLEKEETREKIKQLALDKAAEEKSKNQKGGFGKGLKQRWDTFSGDFSKGWNATKGNKGIKGLKDTGKSLQGAQSGAQALGAAAPYLLAIGAVVAIATTAGAISKAVNEREEKAWTKAKEQVEATNQALVQTKQEYDNITNSISNLNNLETSMDDMVEGSVEWQRALADVNAEVLELLEKYPELAAYIERQENGMLKLSAEGAELAQQKALDRMQAANVANMQAKISAQNAEEEYLANELAEANTYGSQGTADFVAASPAIAAAVGGAIGMIIGPLGAVIGAGIGATVGGIAAAIGEANEEQFKDELEDGTFQEVIDAYKISGDRIFDSETALKEALGENTAVSDELIDSLIDNKEETAKLVAEMAKNQVLERQQYIESGRAIAGPDASDGLAYIAGYQAKIASDAAIAEVKKEMGGGKKADKEAAAKYLAEVYGLSADAITGTKGANKVQYTKDGGSYELDMDTVYGYFASLKGAEATKENLSAYADAIEKLEKTTSDENAQKALNQLATGAVDFSKLTKESLDSLTDHLGKDVLNQIAKLTGKTVTELKKEYEDNLKDVDEAWAKLKEGIHEPVEEALRVVDNSSLSLQQAQQYRDLLINAWDTFGESGVKAINDLVGAFGDDADLFIQKLQTLDWTSSTVENDLLAIINAFGIDIDPTVFDEALSKLKILGDYYTNFDIKHLEEQYANLENIRKKLKATGDTISAEEFEKLGAGWGDYFVKMADGTYALIKSAEEFNAQAQQVQKANAKNALIDQLDNYIARIQENDKREQLQESVDRYEREYERGYQAYQRYRAYMAPKEDEAKRLSNLPASANNQAVQWLKDNKDFVTSVRGYQYNDFYKYINTPGAKNFLPENWQQDLQSLIVQKAESDYIKSIGEVELSDLDFYMRKGSALASGIANYKTQISELSAFTEEDQKAAQAQIRASAEHFFATATNVSEIDEGLALLKDIDFLSDEEKQKYLEAAEKQKILIENARQNFKLEYDRYQILEDEIELLERRLKLLKEEENDAFDKDKIAYIKEQNKLLDDQIAKQNELKDKKEADAAAKKADFDTAMSEYLGEGTEFNKYLAEQGISADVATNAPEIFGALETYLKTHAKKDAEGNVLRDEQGNILYDFDTAEGERAQGIVNLYKEYIQLYKEAEDASDKADAAAREQKDNNAAIIQQAIDAKKKVKDLKLEYQDFKRSLLEDNDYAGIANTYLREAEAIEEEALTFSARRARLDADWAAQRITDAEYQAQLEALNQDAQEAVLALKEAEANVEDQLVSAIEARAEAYDDYIEKIKTANDLYEKQIDLTALLYGEQSEEFFNASVGYYQQISNSYTDILTQSMNAANDAWDTFDKLRTPVEKGGLGLSEEDEAYQAALEEATNAIQEYYDNLGEAVEAAQKAYFAVIDKQLNAFEYGMTGNLGLERLNERWEWQQRMADKYLDTTNRIYETSALAYEFDKAARSTSSLNAQKAINEAKEEELKILREKGKLTQYDLDRAKLRLEITQAEIALQEAQANKTQMRLTRGADGTYSYQYVADMNEVEDKKQELADLNNELYNLDKDKYKENLEEVYDIYAEYIAKIRKFGEDGVFSEDELEDLAQFRDYLKDLAGENSDVWTHLEGLMDRDGIYGKLVEGLTSDTFDTLESELTSALTAAGQIYTETMTELKNRLAEANGENGAGGLLEKFGELTKATTDLIDKMNKAINGKDDEKGLLSHLDDINGKYDALAKSLQNMIDKLQTEIPNLINTADPNQKNTPVTSRLGYIEGNSYNFKGDRSGLWEAYGLTETGDKGAFQAITNKDITAGKYGSTAKLLKIVKDEDGDMDLGLVQFDNGVMMWVDLSRHQLGDDIKGFDTGGYTGDWGSADGRLAMLHRKELVLNEDDTKNFLAGINILRSLDTAMFQTMSSMFKTLDFNTAVHEVINDEAIEQIVYVTAEFPNATDKNEILEAFKEISNLAGQRATKNSRQ